MLLQVYEMLAILDFDNVRKRMSVIVRSTDGIITLYCKGADTEMMSRISPQSDEYLKAKTNEHLDKFASDGLRTLCCAYKQIDPQYFKDWQVAIITTTYYLHLSIDSTKCRFDVAL
jgi:phospholipid-translocating ATPase